MSWQKQTGETNAEYAAFTVYLEKRNLRETADATGKTLAAMKRLSAKYDWQERARAYDNETMAEVRQELSRRLTATLTKQWLECDELKASALAALKQKIDTASPRTLNEIYQQATATQLKIAELFKLDTQPPDNELVITIRDA